ncbi:hypothetical protein D3C75_1343380 [compost metagenome]
MRLRQLHTVECAFGGLCGHLHHVVQAIAGIRNGFRRFGNRLIQAQLTQAVAQHTGQAAYPNDDIAG